MSRCFPFPPPGYEKKPSPEDGDLLKEEKRKEKKHKKDKKDKEKKESKEKKDKDRSDGKHREKKDKKDKHRDKKEKHRDKRDKEKEKDKERSSISEEARIAVLPVASTGQQLPMGDECSKDKYLVSLEAKCPNQSHGQHGGKPFTTSLPAVSTQSSKFVQELARRIRDEQKGPGSQLAERFPIESKRHEKANRVGVKDSGKLAEDKEKNKEQRLYSNKMDAQAVRVEPGIGSNAIFSSFPEIVKSKFEVFPSPLEENVQNRREEKEKSKEKRDEKPRDRKKDKEKDTSHGKEKDKEKEKKKEEKDREKEKKKEEKDKEKEKKEEKEKDKSEHWKSKQDKSRHTNKNDFVSVSNNQVPLVPKDNIAGTVTPGNVRKRKDIETNGFLHESEVRPAKLLRPSSSHQPTQNGKKLGTHQKTDLLSSNKQGVATDIQVGNKERSVNGTIRLSNKLGVATDIEVKNKERRVNGIINGTTLSICEPKASSTFAGVDQIAEPSKRPPHPDSKYLNQMLSVPKMDEWSGYDDQEWLFGSKNTLVRKLNMCSDKVDNRRVWSEALQIESADVCALPYVIPY